MTLNERANRILDEIDVHSQNLTDVVTRGLASEEQKRATLVDLVERHLRAAQGKRIPTIHIIEEAHRDWSHALMIAVEEHFPLPGREWREWPSIPDVAVVCDWLKRLIEEVRADERESRS